MTLSLKNLDTICLAMVIVVSLVCGYLVLNHISGEKRQIRDANDLLSRNLKDLNLADTNLHRLKTVLDTTREELESLNEKIPETSKIGEFLKDVDALMRKRDVVMINLGPMPAVKEKLYTKNPFHLVFKGPFVKIYPFIHDLENMNRTVVMEKVTITKPEEGNNCRVDLLANIFKR